jgi:predicted ATPase
MAALRAPFIGRERELAELRAQLARGERLVTVLGPGGMGKTRLVEQLLSVFDLPLPVTFCDLTRATSMTDAHGVMAEALRVELAGGDPDHQITQAVAARGEILLVLDNLEDIARVVGPFLARILGQAPRARVLGTSRVALRLPGELTYELGPLALPADAHQVETSDAFRLWHDRVRRVRADYDPARDDREALAGLLAQLDGNPLAIELAASRARTLGSRELLTHLSARFELLRTSSRVWDERHRALGTVVEASWDALSAVEKGVLVQLGAFAKSFTADAVAAVVSPSTGRQQAFEVLDSLRDQSLLLSHGPDRLAMYETIRAFVESLGGPSAEARARHAAYYAGVADRLLSREIRTLADRDARNVGIDAERGNLTLAAYGADADHAVMCLAALDVVHPARDPGREFMTAVERATRAVRADPSPRRSLAYALAMAGLAARRADGYDEAAASLDGALALARDLGMTALAWDLRVERALLANLAQGAAASIEDELMAIVEHGPLAASGRASAVLALRRQEEGRLEEARVWAERSVEGLGAGAPPELGYALLCLFEILLDLGDYDAADEAMARARAIQERLGDRRLRAFIANMTGWSLIETDPQAASRTYAAAIGELDADDGMKMLLLGWRGVACFAAVEYAESVVSLERALGRSHAKIQVSMFASTSVAARALLGTLPIERALVDLDAVECATMLDRAWRASLRVLVALRLPTATHARDWVVVAERAIADAPPGVPGRVARALLRRARAENEQLSASLRIAEDGRWFARGSEPPVALAPLPARLLTALADEYERGGDGLSIAQLFAGSWPGERASAISVEERVRAVVKRLRRAGLDDLVEAHGGDFRIAPGTQVERAAVDELDEPPRSGPRSASRSPR